MSEFESIKKGIDKVPDILRLSGYLRLAKLGDKLLQFIQRIEHSEPSLQYIDAEPGKNDPKDLDPGEHNPEHLNLLRGSKNTKLSPLPLVGVHEYDSADPTPSHVDDALRYDTPGVAPPPAYEFADHVGHQQMQREKLYAHVPANGD